MGVGGGRHFICINNHNIRTFQQRFSPYTHTQPHTHTHTHTHTHAQTRTYARTHASSTSLTHARTPTYSRARTQITHTHASALTSTTNEKGGKGRKKNNNIKACDSQKPDQARTALLILLALSSKALEI